ncbi:MAG TPA: lipid kinase [Candidatus Eremiobacteraceae bacterium]|nr:lipid kinase [Candidatus Eremiobacteraceae bacterium]
MKDDLVAPPGEVPRAAPALRRALVLFNDRARRVAPNVTRMLDAIERRGFEIVRPAAPSRSALAEAIRARQHDVDFVIAGGGDGTLNAVLQGLVGTGLPLGLLPLGTANDLARTLKIPSDLDGACDVIAAGHQVRIDVGRVNGVYYFNEASIGLSATLCRQITSEEKKRFGILALLYNAVRLLIKMRRFRALVRMDGGDEFALRTAQLTVGNSQNFGGFIATDDGAIDDRLLDLYSVGFENGWSYFDAMITLLRRKYDEARSVRTLHGRRFEIRTGKPKRIEADGELVTQTPAVFEIVPHAISVFVPAPVVEAPSP